MSETKIDFSFMTKDQTKAHVTIDPAYGWKRYDINSFTIHIAGIFKDLNLLTGVLRKNNPNFHEISKFLCTNGYGQFGLIVTRVDFIFAAVDRIRSFPIFYASTPKTYMVTNNARQARDKIGLKTENKLSILEIAMAGYVTGANTIYNGLGQLQPGEFLFWSLNNSIAKFHRYYRYAPEPTVRGTQEEMVYKLGTIIDNAVGRAIEHANGAQIWVPLSGDLNSRLILSKLVELKYDDIKSFTFGSSGIWEAPVAEQVAKQLQVPWQFIPSNPKKARTLFQSRLRKRFWSFADNLCSVPHLREFEPLMVLKERKEIPHDAFIINGQSGDFITGGHIIKSLLPSVMLSENSLLNDIITKHYSLWSDLKTSENITAIKQKIHVILTELNCSEKTAHLSKASQYEYWEWQERQSKSVINDARIYDFFGYRWSLPLWDSELMDFFEKIPLWWKIDQRIYKNYLYHYNFKNIFTLKHTSPTNHWPTKTKWVPWVGSLLKIIAGKEQKNKWLQRMDYYGYYQNQYALFGREEHLKCYQETRNVASLYSKKWLQENNIGIIKSSYEV